MTAKKNKGGRPSKFDTIDKEQLSKLAKAGWTDKQVSDFFNINESTLNAWKKENLAFSKSLKNWKAEADHEVERSLFERAKGFVTSEDKVFGSGDEQRIEEVKKQYPPDTTACIFWLKNRQPKEWRDKVDHSHNHEYNGDPAGISDAELAEVIAGAGSKDITATKSGKGKPH